MDNNLEVFGEDLAPSESFVEGDLAVAISSLLQNETVGDQLRGTTWAERAEEHVGLTEDGAAIRYLRIRVDVEAQSSAMVEQISEEMGAEASIVSSDTGGRAYAVGDLMTLVEPPFRADFLYRELHRNQPNRLSSRSGYSYSQDRPVTACDTSRGPG